MTSFPIYMIQVDPEKDRIILGFVWLDSNTTTKHSLNGLPEISKYIGEDNKILPKFKRQIEKHLNLADEMENCKYRITPYRIKITKDYNQINYPICNLYTLDSK